MRDYFARVRALLNGGSDTASMQTARDVGSLEQRMASGIANLRTGHIESARDCFCIVLRDQPDNHQALHYLGIAEAQTGNLALAADLIGKAVRISPPDAEMASNLGNALRGLGQSREALAAYECAIEIDSAFLPAHMSRGSLCLEMGELSSALESFEKSLTLAPASFDGWTFRGYALTRQGRHEEALASFERALALNPLSTNALVNCGCALTALQRFNQAITIFNRAAVQDPDNFLIQYNLGALLLDGLMLPSSALPHLDAAVRLRPEDGAAYERRAVALDMLGRCGEAIADYQNALQHSAGSDITFGLLLHSKLRICAWDGLFRHVAQILDGIAQGQYVVAPLTVLAISGKLSVQRQVADVVSRNYRASVPSVPRLEKYQAHERIRIGYFSADLREHAIAILTAELFELHDREKYEIVVFSFGAFDHVTQRVDLAVEDFIDARTLCDEDVVKLARSMEIDIAVDLGGYTVGNRSCFFSMRVAPIQIAYLGYPATMGEDMHDYLIADRILIPQESEHWYAEKIIRLPVFQINDSRRKISPRIFSREELGLPESGFVYCCFNNTFKFNPEVFDVWAQILAEVECSVLYLLSISSETTENILKEFEKRGIARTRIVIGGRIPTPEYLARYRTCDLFLDTWPFNAGTTASDALWTGLPVLTCMCEAFAGRMAGSLLTALELPELIAHSLEEYQRIAVELALNRSKLESLRMRLDGNIRDGLLFDTRTMTRTIEAAYSAVYERYQCGLPPESISVSS